MNETINMNVNVQYSHQFLCFVWPEDHEEVRRKGRYAPKIHFSSNSLDSEGLDQDAVHDAESECLNSFRTGQATR